MNKIRSIERTSSSQRAYQGHTTVYKVISDTHEEISTIKRWFVKKQGLEPKPDWFHVRVTGVQQINLVDGEFNNDISGYGYLVTTLDPYKD